VGGPPQPNFLNAVIIGETSLPAQVLLTLLRNLERAAGREPSAEKNASRPLDLDLLLYGSRRIATPRLHVPHPRMTSRLFVLVPLADVAPRRVVPGTGKTVARFLAEARRRSTESVRRARASF
jgi:2-amino-4-hydroxy-6-hydroxymethyldihydropteridine diphosphokinase